MSQPHQNEHSVQAILDAMPDDLTPWQREFAEQVIAHAIKGDRLEYRFLGRKIGYGFAWVPDER